MKAVSLKVSAPICAFRKAYARDFLETERVPPPATVYGFLLSMVGEERRRAFEGTRLAIAVSAIPRVSLVLRTTWRVKARNLPPGLGNNRIPDYQEVLTGLELAVWVDAGGLAERLKALRKDPSQVIRYGGLSLGESRDLVDEVCFDPCWSETQGLWLSRDSEGDLPLPVWVDHVGSKGTCWVQFRMEEGELSEPPAGDPRWITIRPRDE